MPTLQLSYSKDRIYCRIGVRRIPPALRELGNYTPVGWLWPISAETAPLLLALAALSEWKITEPASSALNRHMPHQKELVTAEGNRYTVPGLITDPRAYQADLAAQLRTRDGALLDLKMGRGKTLITLIALMSGAPCNVLIVAPKRGMRVWQEDWEKHFTQEQLPNFLILDQSSSAAKVKAMQRFYGYLHSNQLHHNVVVINYESMWRPPLGDILLASPWSVVVFDECHRLQSPSSKQSWFAKSLRPRVPRMWGLSGTPLPNGPISIYGTARALNPQLFGTNYTHFKYRYAIWQQVGDHPNQSKPVHYINQEDYATKYGQLRLTAVVSDDDLGLPTRTDVQWRFDLSSKERKVYLQMLQEYIVTLSDDTSILAANAAVKLAKCLQITSGFVKGDIESNVDIVPVGTSKQETLAELLENLSPDEPVVIFYRFRQSAINIQEVCHKVGRYYFEVSGRTDQVQQWANGPEGAVLAAQLKSASEALNDLVKAQYGIYYEPTFSYREYHQSSARLHRPGQTRPVMYYHFIGRNTVEEKVFKLIEDKKNVIDYINDLTAEIRREIRQQKS